MTHLSKPDADVHDCVESNDKLVKKIAKSFQRTANRNMISYEDLIHQGKLALIQACKSFDPNKEVVHDGETRTVEFSTYAYEVIRRTLANYVRPPSQLPETLTVYRKVKRTEAQLQKQLPRVPTNEEIAFEAEVDIEIVRRCLQSLVTVSVDAPIYDGDVELPPLLENVQAVETPDQYTGEELPNSTELLTRLLLIIEQAGLSTEEDMVLRYRWGLDQGLKPRPRARVAEILANEHNDDRYVITGERRENSGTRPEYMTDRIRTLELRATRKVGEAFHRWKSAND